MRVRCPYCTAIAIARTSRQVSRLTKEFDFQCTRVECGHTFTGLLGLVHTISPPAAEYQEDIGLEVTTSHQARVAALRKAALMRVETSDYSA